MSAASAVVTVIAQKAGGAVVSLEVYPFSIRLTNAIVAYVRDIRQSFLAYESRAYLSPSLARPADVPSHTRVWRFCWR